MGKDNCAYIKSTYKKWKPVSFLALFFVPNHNLVRRDSSLLSCLNFLSSQTYRTCPSQYYWEAPCISAMPPSIHKDSPSQLMNIFCLNHFRSYSFCISQKIPLQIVRSHFKTCFCTKQDPGQALLLSVLKLS